MEDEREEVINRNFDRFSRLKPIRYRKRLESHSAPSSPTRNTVKQTPRKSKSHSDFRKLVGSLIGPAYQEIDIEDKELEWDDYNEQPSFVEPGTDEPLDIGLDIRDNSGNREDPALEINLPEISEGGIFKNNEGGNPIETEEVTDVNRQIEEMAPDQENEQMGTDVDNILLLFGELEMRKDSLDPDNLGDAETVKRDLEEIRENTKELLELVIAYSRKHGRKTAEETPHRAPDEALPDLVEIMTPAFLKNKFNEVSRGIKAHGKAVKDKLKESEAAEGPKFTDFERRQLEIEERREELERQKEERKKAERDERLEKEKHKRQLEEAEIESKMGTLRDLVQDDLLKLQERLLDPMKSTDKPTDSDFLDWEKEPDHKISSGMKEIKEWDKMHTGITKNLLEIQVLFKRLKASREEEEDADVPGYEENDTLETSKESITTRYEAAKSRICLLYTSPSPRD